MYPDQPKRKRRYIIIAVGVVIAIVLVIVLTMHRSSDNSNTSSARPQQTSDTFVQEVVQGQADESYKLFADTTKAFTSANSWKLTVAKLKGSYKGQPQAVNPATAKVSGSITVQQFKYRIAAQDKGNYILTVYLTSNNGQWQVLQFNSAREGATN